MANASLGMSYNIQEIIETALREDIGAGDITTTATVDKKAEGSAEIIVKDNHIVAVGSITEAVLRARENIPHNMLIEVEAKDLDEVRDAILAGADVIMLDNMKPAVMKQAVKIIGKKALIEASGGVNLQNVMVIAKTGVDFISVGALTHSARAVDISMEVVSSR